MSSTSTAPATVVMSPLPLSQYAHACHHRAAALARAAGPVLYVDPPLSPLSVVRHPERRADVTGPRAYTGDHGLRIWRPWVLPGQQSPVAGLANGRHLARGVRRHLGTDPGLVLTASLANRQLLDRTTGTKIYLCDDSYEDLPGADPTAVRRVEDAVMARCDVVVACSLPLVEKLARRGVDARYVPHGADPAMATATSEAEVPPELAGLPRPYVGYVGTLNPRVDLRLLQAALDATDEGTLVLVGGAFASSGSPPPGLARFVAQPRVAALPHRPWSALGPWLAAFDVGLVPYAPSPFARASFPLKVLDYLAAGVPVVSTANGATDELGASVAVADTPETFGAAVRRVVDEGGGGAAGRREAALARTWDHVAADLLALAGAGRGVGA